MVLLLESSHVCVVGTPIAFGVFMRSSSAMDVLLSRDSVAPLHFLFFVITLEPRVE